MIRYFRATVGLMYEYLPFSVAHDKSSLTQVVKVFVCFECLCAAQREGSPFSSRDNTLKALESNRARDSQLEKGDFFGSSWSVCRLRVSISLCCS